MSQEQELAQLAAEARYATDRVALYQQRMYAGTGDQQRLAELERIAAGATERLRVHEVAQDVQPAAAPPRTQLGRALDDVAARLDVPGLPAAERHRLLQRQAELGDLRDELALRARRLAGERDRPPRRR
jgi:hypothetical protein